MKENNEVKTVGFDGEVTIHATYDGKFSAEYALFLYWCQYVAKCDHNNLCNFARFQGKRTIARHSAFIEHGMDIVSCVATTEHGRNPLIGETHGRYAYKPKYITQ